jgi:hypothetical protein
MAPGTTTAEKEATRTPAEESFSARFGLFAPFIYPRNAKHLLCWQQVLSLLPDP